MKAPSRRSHKPGGDLGEDRANSVLPNGTVSHPLAAARSSSRVAPGRAKKPIEPACLGPRRSRHLDRRAVDKSAGSRLILIANECFIVVPAHCEMANPDPCSSTMTMDSGESSDGRLPGMTARSVANLFAF
jgi:hypothetical protein